MEAVANWSVNSNTSLADNSVVVKFYETNSTKTLSTDLTTNIALDRYMDPLDPTTKMLSDFAHVFVVYNPNKPVANKSGSLFSMTYSAAS